MLLIKIIINFFKVSKECNPKDLPKGCVQTRTSFLHPNFTSPCDVCDMVKYRELCSKKGGVVAGPAFDGFGTLVCICKGVDPNPAIKECDGFRNGRLEIHFRLQY